MNTSSKLHLAATLVAAMGLQPAFAQEAARSSHLNDEGKEVIHHRVNSELHTFGLAPTSGSTSALSTRNKLSYHGDSVFSTPTVYLIWYGNWNQSNGTDTAAGQAIITDFFQHIGGSPYYTINSHYVGSSNAISGNVTYGGATTVSGYPNGTALSDATIQTIVQNAINGGFGPAGGDTNGLYFVLTSSDVNESSGFCTQYCGWHFNGTINGRDIKYAFVGNAARCITSCAAQSTSPNGNAGVDGMISVLAHELEEANTDADGNAWYARSGNENGDDCAWTFGTTYVVSNGSYANMKLGTRDYLIQRNVDFRSTGNQYCDLSHK
jgi:hypothetical protein